MYEHSNIDIYICRPRNIDTVKQAQQYRHRDLKRRTMPGPKSRREGEQYTQVAGHLEQYSQVAGHLEQYPRVAGHLEQYALVAGQIEQYP
jgi:hypothetical protein